MSPFMLEGRTLGKYRVLEALGRGGMAQVYRGYHPQLDRYVAIKVLRADLVEDEKFLKRFRQEAHAVSGLRHANIVQVFDFDVQDNYYYMVMELLEGDTLRARLNEYRLKKQRMPLDEIVQVLTDVLNGLEYAHSEGVIHRDIKPANVMLTKKGQAVLTDFGIAQIMGSTQATVSGALMGTLNYMAPEQGLEGQCDARSDIYSLGIVLYEMLTGYTPFDADTPLAILMKHLNDPLPLPSQLDPNLPPSLEQIVLKALSKSPADRYQSAAEMAAALQKLVNNLSGETRQMVSPPEGYAPQVVFSGNSRQQIANRRFASEDTDLDIQPVLSDGNKASITASSPQVPLGKRLNRLIENPPTALGAILSSLGLILVFNMFAAMVVTVTRQNIYNVGWAFEIYLAAGFFTLLAWAINKPWLLTPAIIIFGNAVILSYCALTGRWDDWIFLWMFEPMIVAVAILLPMSLKKNAERGIYWTRVGSLLLTVAAVLLAVSTCWLSFIINLFT
ncbi:MAG: serine/threonine protein kinase [Anaerolineales bacterium]|nr:serine/threonine protein kinase [Anaerolineales bacterium]